MDKNSKNPISQILSLEEFTKAIDKEYERRKKEKKPEVVENLGKKLSLEEVKAKRIETIIALKRNAKNYIYEFCETHEISKIERQNLEAMVLFYVDAVVGITDHTINLSDLTVFDFETDF